MAINPLIWFTVEYKKLYALEQQYSLFPMSRDSTLKLKQLHRYLFHKLLS